MTRALTSGISSGITLRIWSLNILLWNATLLSCYVKQPMSSTCHMISSPCTLRLTIISDIVHSGDHVMTEVRQFKCSGDEMIQCKLSQTGEWALHPRNTKVTQDANTKVLLYAHALSIKNEKQSRAQSSNIR